ncbi:MAG TPA: ABC transporter permease, partial [Roseovarius sp.]|nr:ABC transporter permease [Roseovarius sp.]
MDALSWGEIILRILTQFIPVWIALIATFALSITLKRRLGLYGKLFDSPIGMVGFALVMFWVFTGIFGGAFDLITTHDVLDQSATMKNKGPGTPYTKLMGEVAPDAYPFYLLGGDNLGRDVFSRMVVGAWEVIKIAP